MMSKVRKLDESGDYPNVRFLAESGPLRTSASDPKQTLMKAFSEFGHLAIKVREKTDIDRDALC